LEAIQLGESGIPNPDKLKPMSNFLQLTDWAYTAPYTRSMQVGFSEYGDIADVG
jgi:hypothetical protein